MHGASCTGLAVSRSTVDYRPIRGSDGTCSATSNNPSTNASLACATPNGEYLDDLRDGEFVGRDRRSKSRPRRRPLAAHRHEDHPVHYRRGQKRAEKGRKPPFSSPADKRWAAWTMSCIHSAGPSCTSRLMR